MYVSKCERYRYLERLWSSFEIPCAEVFACFTDSFVVVVVVVVVVGVLAGFNTELAPRLWQVLDSEIRVKECDIYSYIPDLDSDPYAEEGNMYDSFVFFFLLLLLLLLLLQWSRASNEY